MHIPLSAVSARVWTGRYHEWVYRAGCGCGWSTLANTEQLAMVTAQEHARVQNAAMEFSRR